MKKPRLFSDMIVVTLLAFLVAIYIDFLGSYPFACTFTPAIYAVYGVVVLLLLRKYLYGKFEPKRIAVILLFSFAMVALYYAPTTSRKPFLRDLNRVHVDMTVPEVEAIMGKYIKGYDVEAAEFYIPDEDGNIRAGYRHSDSSTFDADIGVVNFKDGKVVSIEFLPD